MPGTVYQLTFLLAGRMGGYRGEGRGYIYLLDHRLGNLIKGTCHKIFWESPTVEDSYSRPLTEGKSSIFYCPIPRGIVNERGWREFRGEGIQIVSRKIPPASRRVRHAWSGRRSECHGSVEGERRGWCSSSVRAPRTLYQRTRNH